MKTFHIVTVAIFVLQVTCCFLGSAAEDESKEPLQEYAVKIGGKSFTLTEGETVQANGTFNNPRISLKPAPYRVFPYQGVSFQYPQSFIFEADISDNDAKIWTLSGNDLKIMYFVMNVQLSTAEFADNLISEFGRENSKVLNGNAKITLGKETLSGKIIQTRVVGTDLLIDIYRVPSAGNFTKFLVFQDCPDEKGNRSKEGQEALKMMRASFELK